MYNHKYLLIINYNLFIKLVFPYIFKLVLHHLFVRTETHNLKVPTVMDNIVST